MFLEPMLLGRYPADLMPLFEDVIVEPGDLATIRQPLDFYGVNYYNPMKIAAAPEDSEMPFESATIVGYPTTDFGWPVVPDALREWLIMFRARYRAALPPIYITESGCSYNMGPDEHGVVDDQPRIDYLDVAPAGGRRGDPARRRRARLLHAGRCWTTSSGPRASRQRFGLVHVDYETLEAHPQALLRLVRPGHRRHPLTATCRWWSREMSVLVARDVGSGGATCGLCR